MWTNHVKAFSICNLCVHSKYYLFDNFFVRNLQRLASCDYIGNFFILINLKFAVDNVNLKFKIIVVQCEYHHGKGQQTSIMEILAR